MFEICACCNKQIFDGSRSYEKRLEQLRKNVERPDIHVCDRCIKVYSNSVITRMVSNAIANALLSPIKRGGTSVFK